ncbi:MAG: tRNA (N6-isopentenyl adenosine(37)-C2)-methylthiotransferase MiaB [Candidatus Obscuribacterales bacterium]|nr:tRNA (N6-isopentenyl adenosine(37)-C2)-methylthiotransferase MiaB [Candidatus Obscuribacterales bacterium]
MTQSLAIIDDKSKKRAEATVYIETFGCQMNKADSENMLGLLSEIGYSQIDDINNADLMVLNTCAIREGAEDKLFSYLGRWTRIKEQSPGKLIAVGGCVAQHAGATLLKRGVDIVFGTHNLFRLPELVLQAKNDGQPVVEIYQELPEDLPELPVIRQSNISAWVSVIYGCDYNCTYCIVPYVRGREKSRPADQVIKDIEELADAGYLEVTLLGQNVTAYGHDLSPQLHLGDLLRMTAKLDSIKRVRFFTGHPRDLSDEIIEAVAESPNACNHFHIPIQAGDDRTLRRMARGYKVDFYRRMVEKIRAKMPDAAISSDMIVGFPGETEQEFMNSVNLVEEIGFDSCITAAYSPRPHTPSANWPGQVPETEKYERLRFLNSVVGGVAQRRNTLLIGKTVEVLVEGKSPRNPDRMSGRSTTNKIINFDGGEELVGKLVNVQVESANAWALRAKLV